MLKLVINLDRSTERWVSMRNKLSQLKITADRVSAVEGKKLDKNTLSEITTKSLMQKMICPRELTLGEIGCFLSHRNCWERLLSSDENFALIMEDDIVFSNRATQYLLNSKWILPNTHLIQLSTLIPSPHKATVDKLITLSCGDELLHVRKPIPWGTQAYIISREAAESAIRMSTRIGIPVDDFLFNPLSEFSQKYPSYRLNPSVITHDDLNLYPSTLDTNLVKKHRNYTLVDGLRLFLKCLKSLHITSRFKQRILYFK